MGERMKKKLGETKRKKTSRVRQSATYFFDGGPLFVKKILHFSQVARMLIAWGAALQPAGVF
jgi:hypothetical protein